MVQGHDWLSLSGIQLVQLCRIIILDEKAQIQTPMLSKAKHFLWLVTGIACISQKLECLPHIP
jgi:hypothetical protein